MKTKSAVNRIVVTLLCFVMMLGIFATPIFADSETSITRLGGENRFETSTVISREGWDSSQSIVLASAASFADALAGVPLAYALDAPILLVSSDSVAPSVMSEITRLGADSAYILGGEAAVSKAVESQIAASCTVTRIAGGNRFETAGEIADHVVRLQGVPSEVFIVNSANYPDALSVSPVAAINGSPILYADATGTLNSATATRVGNREIHIIGGTSVIPTATVSALTRNGASMVRRTGGSDRFDTMLKVNTSYASLFTGDSVCVATGTNYPDALAGGVFAAKNSSPVVLVSEKAATDAIAPFIRNIDPASMYIFGGTSVVSNDLVQSLIRQSSITTTTTAATTTTTSATDATTTTTTEATTTTTTRSTSPTDSSGPFYIYADTIVYRANASSVIFHRSSDCSSMRSPSPLTYTQALEHGLRPCSNCCANCIYV